MTKMTSSGAQKKLKLENRKTNHIISDSNEEVDETKLGIN